MGLATSLLSTDLCNVEELVEAKVATDWEEPNLYDSSGIIDLIIGAAAALFIIFY